MSLLEFERVVGQPGHWPDTANPRYVAQRLPDGRGRILRPLIGTSRLARGQCGLTRRELAGVRLTKGPFCDEAGATLRDHFSLASFFH